MPIQINGILDVRWPTLLDFRSGQQIGSITVPYDSVAQALAALPLVYRAEGLVLYVRAGANLEWWQFVDGRLDSDLRKIDFGGDGTGVTQDLQSVLTEGNTANLDIVLSGLTAVTSVTLNGATFNAVPGGNVDLGLIDTGGQTEVFTWKYTSNPSPGDPGNGNFRMDNISLESVGELWIDDLTSDVVMDISAMFGAINGNWLIHIQQANDADKFAQFRLFGNPVDMIGWWIIPVQFIQSGGGGGLTNGQKCTFIFINENGEPITTAIPNLQQVTDEGAVTTNVITAQKFIAGTGTIDPVLLTAPRTYQLPNNDGIIPISVAINGTAHLASTAGAIDLGTISSGATDLAYTAAPTNGIVTSNTGADATLPLADATNAGLMAPGDFIKLAGPLTGTITAPSGTITVQPGLYRELILTNNALVSVGTTPGGTDIADTILVVGSILIFVMKRFTVTSTIYITTNNNVNYELYKA